MAHFVRTHTDPGWIGLVFDPGGAEFNDATTGLDVKTFKAINGDDGGTWSPSSSINIGGAGLRVTGPCLVSNFGVIETLSGARFKLGDNDYPVLAPGHTGATRVLVNPVILATSTGTMRTTGGGIVTQATGQTFIIPLVETHNGATATQLVFNFTVADPHAGGVPAVFPRVRVFRVSSAGVVTPLTSVGAGADVNGWVSMTAGSGGAWYNGGASKTFTLTLDQNNVIDVVNYSYVAMIQDESGTNATNGNTWLPVALTVGSITDMRFQ